MRCLILGGGGFIGSHLSEALLAKGHMIRIFERPRLKLYSDARILINSKMSLTGQVEWIEGDFTNFKHIDDAIKDCKVIFHFICTTLPKDSNDNPIYDIESNVIPTIRLLDAARRNGIKKIVFISSGGTVYGIPSKQPISETHPTDPVCSYGISKLIIEKYLNLYRHLYDFNHCILRVSNLYGERQRTPASQGAIANFIYGALKKETITIWGNGSVVRDYIYIKDLCEALLKAMNYSGDENIFNIGSGEGHSLNDILKIIESSLGQPLKRIYTEGRALDVPVNIMDISKAGKLLGWRPKTPLQTGIMQTINWMKRYAVPEEINR